MFNREGGRTSRVVRGLTLPLERKGGEVRNDLGQLLGQQIHGLPHENQLGVVGHEAAGRAVVHDAGGGRGNDAKGVHVLKRWSGWKGLQDSGRTGVAGEPAYRHDIL